MDATHTIKCDLRPLPEASDPSPHPCIPPVVRMQGSSSIPGGPWPFFATCQARDAAETSRLRPEHSLPCRLMPVWRDASSRIGLLCGLAQSVLPQTRRARIHCFVRAVSVVIVTRFIATHRKTQR